ERTIALFDLIDLTTFRIWSLPDTPDGDTVAIRLEQAYSDAALPLSLVRDGKGAWRIRMPTAEELTAARRVLLASSGGRPRPAEAFRRLESPRDTMRAFLRGMTDWGGAGRELALSTLDLRDIPEAIRQTQGALVAQYLLRVLDRIGLVGLQGIPNDGRLRDA